MPGLASLPIPPPSLGVLYNSPPHMRVAGSRSAAGFVWAPWGPVVTPTRPQDSEKEGVGVELTHMLF